MNYDYLINKAIQNNEAKDLLCGKKPYEVEVSKYTSDVFPTDINSVLVNCFYKQLENAANIKEIFENNLKQLLNENACNVYIAILYFDACIFYEEIGKATFFINREILVRNIKEAVYKNKDELTQIITFENGMKKYNPLKNIENFNKYYEKEYSFSIV
ncbi:hypothetical protein [Virgibacillus sp. SK37]|uniref:hypothetical protein n=1 Tax=Virgibacillus sp. SK37 TaxID=403957 RepID=UPI0004D12EE3|nr:hypothetical protein [Virgibacillus sp. SK37]AIF45200.1 hypothetical protein X953_04500 [Virgibacillus sp. SK37]